MAYSPLQFPTDSSDALKAHIKQSERRMMAAYFDPAGVPTAGYGHIRGITADMARRKVKFSDAQVDAWFEADLDEAERVVRKYVQVQLLQGEFDALVDFVFNLGEGNFKTSTLLKVLNSGDYSAVPAQLERWTKAKDPQTGKLVDLPGLVIRRKWEADLWRTWAAKPANYGSAEHQATVTPAPTKANTTLFGLIVQLVLNLIASFNPRAANA